MVKQMRPGSVIIDVAVDQGGVIETADRVTTPLMNLFMKNTVFSTMLLISLVRLPVLQPLP